MWYKQYGWKYNPFSVKYSTHLVGFEKEKKALLDFVSAGDVCVIVGDPGVGKTSLLMWLQKNLDWRHKAIYINAESISEDLELKKIVGSPLFRKRVLLLDEAHNCDEELVKEMKALWDKNIVKSIVITQIGHNLEYPESFKSRIGKRVLRIEGMDYKMAKELINQRTNNKHPFSDDVIELIVDDAKNNPRKILENCELLCIELQGKKITAEAAKEILTQKKADMLLGLEKLEEQKLPDNLIPIDNKKLSGFSPMQKRIILLLLDGNRTAKQMAEILNTTEGSVGKQLSMLIERQAVCIANHRRPKVYSLSSMLKSELR